MAAHPHLRVVAVAAALFVAVAVMPREAQAQAWVPAQGEISFATVYQSQNVKKHLAATTPMSAGTIDTSSVMADFTYGLTDKLAVDVALPYVMSKYEGPCPHPGTNIDDGTYRGTFADVRFAVRYNITRNHGVITPYVGSAMPSHDYAYYGHAAPGQRLRELQLGVFAAKLFEAGVPGMFISGRYCTGSSRKCRISRTTGARPISRWVTSSLRPFAPSRWSTGCTRTATPSTFRSRAACAALEPDVPVPCTTRFRRCTPYTPAEEWPTRSATRWISSRRSRSWSSAATATRSTAASRSARAGASRERTRRSVVMSTDASLGRQRHRKERGVADSLRLPEIRCVTPTSGATSGSRLTRRRSTA